MTASMTADVTHRGPLPQTGTLLRAQIGDTLLIEDESVASTPRIGRILAVSSPDGSPPYRVRWLAGEYESLITPGPGARVEKGH
jgi:hypothetical protein